MPKSKKAKIKSEVKKRAKKAAPRTGKLSTLKQKLSDYGIAVDDVKARARQLEQVLKDLKNRDFLKQPQVQALIERVTKKTVAKSNVEAQQMAKSLPRKSKKSKSSAKSEKQFLNLSNLTAQRLGHALVQSVLKRVEEVRKNLSDSRRKK